jgi:DNA-binding FadR family transcriptional regulator
MHEDCDKRELTLVESTQQKILGYITNGKYQPNQALPKEDELANMLGVSRVIVRETLSRLRALGFLETRKKKGTTLVSPRPFGTMGLIINSGALDEDSVSDLYELRLMLEIGMADFVFERKDEQGMSKLRTLVEEEDCCEDDNRLVEIDVAFHTILYSMANSRSLSTFQSLLGKIFTLYPARRPENWRQHDIVSHRNLYLILNNGTPDSFRSAMRLHLTYQFENRGKYLKAYYDKMGLK